MSSATPQDSDTDGAAASSSKAGDSTSQLTNWIRALPKVELHAHLSGSVKEETVLQMLHEEAAQIQKAQSQGQSDAPSPAPISAELSTFQFGDRSLSECFHVFRILHRLLSTLTAIKRVTKEVIQDFAADGVVYLELRTTPRALSKEGTTKRQYVEAVVATIRECEKTIKTPSGDHITVRLLLSVDRSQSMEEAESTLALAKEFSSEADPIVVGLDFSGNPTIGNFRDFQHIFQSARESNKLKSSIHIGEKADDDLDLDAALEFRPERIGHVVCLSQRHVDQLLEKPIPIEICPTSNLKTQIVKEWKDHPFGVWRDKAKELGINASPPPDSSIDSHYPMVVCTDDSGVFNITLTSELVQLSNTFGLSQDELFKMEKRSIEYTFVNDEKKAQLTKLFDKFAAARGQ